MTNLAVLFSALTAIATFASAAPTKRDAVTVPLTFYPPPPGIKIPTPQDNGSKPRPQGPAPASVGGSSSSP